MKKVFDYLRSMRFGILLLVLIAACSVAGSVIPQGREIGWYAQTYQSFHGAILMLGLNRVFQSWYFILLLVLLCLNLSLCSLLRIFRVVRAAREENVRAAAMPDQIPLSGKEREALAESLRTMGCEEKQYKDALLFRKNGFGRYGSFITHLSILLVAVFGAMALYLPQVTDQSCLPGEELSMPDGARIAVESFRIENPEGELDFESRLRITLPDGRQSETRSVKVNHPMSFGNYKVYQQTYGTAGSITVTNLQTGGHDDFTLTDEVFLSLDGVNGLWYEALYPGYIRDPSGNMTLITSTQGRYTDPVYQVLLASDGVYTPALAFPGESVRVYDLEFSFNDPVEYPGLRIKRTPTAVNGLLCASFVLMIAGLYITFFLQPVLVKLSESGCAVGGPKPEGTRIRIEELLREFREEKRT